ncbi:MAG: hypothetical protein K1X28_02165 [Parachlamydiales bacterium]|nr:hypothetical protein [Parachlamydiales bacterium]
MAIYSNNSLRQDLWEYINSPSSDKLEAIDWRISRNYFKADFRKDMGKLFASCSLEEFERSRENISKKFRLIQFQKNMKFLVENHLNNKGCNPLHIVNWDFISWSEGELDKACEWAQRKVDEIQSPFSLFAAGIGACAAGYAAGGIVPALFVGSAAIWAYNWFRDGLNGGIQDDKASSIFASVVGAGASLITSAGLIRTAFSGALTAGAYKCFQIYRMLGNKETPCPEPVLPSHTPQPHRARRSRLDVVS